LFFEQNMTINVLTGELQPRNDLPHAEGHALYLRAKKDNLGRVYFWRSGPFLAGEPSAAESLGSGPASPEGQVKGCSSGELKPSAPKKTGPKPIKFQAVTQKMVADYTGNAAALENEKQETLKAQYGVSADTVRKSREAALLQLNSDKQTPIIDK
jgi:hypothetical protein